MTALLLRCLTPLLLILQSLGGMSAWAGDDFLPPEQAFRFEARMLDAHHVEVVYTVTEGYYLYRERFAFAADSGAVTLGTPTFPPGKIKYDETFGKELETHRGRVVIQVPLEATVPAFTLTVTSQGCADAGLCYPPMQSTQQLTLPSATDLGPLTRDADALRPATPPSRIDAALRSGHLSGVVGVFFVAGLLLSLTPCVLPMLPILSSIVVGTATGSVPPSRARGLGLALVYTLGMALAYTALGVAAGLVGAGLAATLQTPWVLGAFAALMAALALSMFGYYELQLPAAWRDRLDGHASRLQGGRWVGVFVMGGLSALIVSPCVAAPLAGALLYISQSRDVVLGGSALFSLAAGMGVPLLLVGASAGALLPQAGPWMESIRRFFGVLLLGVAWWTLTPLLPAPVAVGGWGVLSLVAASLCGAFDRPDREIGRSADAGAHLTKAVGLALAVLGATQLVGAAAGADNPLQPLRPLLPTAQAASSSSDVAAASSAAFQPVRNEAELEAVLHRTDRPVMLVFAADWCVSCKEMERDTYTDPRVRARLAQLQLLRVDVTHNTADDQTLLRRFALFGPPGIVFFDAHDQVLDSPRVVGYQSADLFLQSLALVGS